MPVKKDDAVVELVDHVHKLDIKEAKDKHEEPTRQRRRALGERNANSRVEEQVKSVQRKGGRRKAEKTNDKEEDAKAKALTNEANVQPALVSDAGDSAKGLAEHGNGMQPFESPGRAPEVQLLLSQDDKENDEPPEYAPDIILVAEGEVSNDQLHIEHSHTIQNAEPPPSNLPVRNIYTQHCQPLLALSSHPMMDFAQWSEQLASHFSLTKIAEASFGEVYRISLLEDIPGLSRSDESVFKVIALKAPCSTMPRDAKKRKVALKEAEAMSKVEEVANEVKLLQRMSSIPGFTNFRDVRILQGRPPALFIDAFKSWNDNQKARKKDLSVFPDPAKKTSYDENQLWAVIEMQDAGTDLERSIEAGQARDIWTVWDAFWQVILSLGKGEEGAEFEHRDLHLGNICVRSSPNTTTNTAPIDVRKKLNFTNLETTIIDYTISRCIMPSHETAYTDLSDASQASLFEGDSTDEYQYDIYRYMRGAALLSDPMADYSLSKTQAKSAQALTTGRNWKDFHPITNLIWLHFILYKLLEQVKWPSRQKAPPKKTKAREHAEWKRANDLEHKLLKVQNLLDPETVCSKDSSIRSASDLVALALSEGWLDVSDVMGEVSVSAEDEDKVLGSESAEAETGHSSELREKMSGLKVRVNLIEECGLEIAEEEARANTRKVRKGRGKK